MDGSGSRALEGVKAYVMITQDELDRIAARVAAATPGPWRATPGDGYQPIDAPRPPKVTNKGYRGATAEQKPVPIVSLGNHAGCSDPACCADSPFVQVSEKDALFIASAREDVPRLLEEIRRLRGEGS